MRSLIVLVGIARRACRSRSGNIAVAGSLFLSVAIGLAAVAVDSGSIYLERRHVQNTADLTAIAVASQLSKAEDIAREMLGANGYKNVTVSLGTWEQPVDTPADVSDLTAVLLEIGRYNADSELRPEVRFVPGRSNPNAVRVTMKRQGGLYFGRAFLDAVEVSATGTAMLANPASVSIGSTLVSYNGGIANAVLNGVLGTNVSFRLMDYRSLVQADVELFQFFDALAGELELEALSYDQLLEVDVSLAQLAKVAEGQVGDAGARRALRQIWLDPASGSMRVRLNRVIDFGRYGALALGDGQAAFRSKMRVVDALIAAAGSAGRRQVELDLSASVSRVARLTATIAIGERPKQTHWLSIGESGEKVRTAQTRLYLLADIDAGVVQLRLPIYLDLGYAEAAIESATCHSGAWAKPRVDVLVRPGLAEVWLGEVSSKALQDFESPTRVGRATIIDSTYLRAHAIANIDVGNTDTKTVVFRSADIGTGVIKQVSTTTPVQSLIGSLIERMRLEAKVGGVALAAPGAATSLIVNAIRPVARELDRVIIEVLTLAGVRIGVADVKVGGLACSHAVLVQ
ncbi:MAG: hypothetical protein JJ864_01125 [Rhizobiaceae bacterium]|nr:hypothetical protein [Rhizobiaceae bacterium]